MSKVNLWVGFPFLLFGLIFSGIGVYQYASDLDLIMSGSRAEGTVVRLASSYDSDGGRMYRPVVEFRDRNGAKHQFTESIGSSPPSFSRGEKVEVVYDEWSPEDAKINSFVTRYLLPLAFGGFGSIFGLVGAGLIFAYFRRKSVIAKLKEKGIRISAKFTQSYLDTGTKINGRSPYRVTAQAVHPATGKLASFKSDAIWLDLAEVLEGRDVPVLVDPHNAKHHFMDLSEYVSEDEEA